MLDDTLLSIRVREDIEDKLEFEVEYRGDTNGCTSFTLVSLSNSIAFLKADTEAPTNF